MIENKKYTNPYLKSLTSGVSVVGEMALGGLFLENLKMEKQRTSKPYSLLAKNILKQGLKGIEAGLFPWGLTIGMTKGMSLGLSHSIIKNECNKYGLSNNTTTYISGLGAGAFQGMCISPLMVARTRINKAVTDRTKAGSWIQELKFSSSVLGNAVKSEGISVIFSGMGATIAKRSLDWGLRFGFKGKLDEYFEPKNNMEKIGTSFGAGIISALITTPIDRALPLLQSTKEGFGTVMREKIKNEGYGTLLRGYGVRAIHTGWHTMFAIVVSEIMYDAFTK